MRHAGLEHDDRERRDEPALGAEAGIFLLEGGYHVAAFGGRAALRLRERGALLIAALRFQAAPAGPPPLRLAPIMAPRDLARLGGAPREN